jgi:hypothetical protein
MRSQHVTVLIALSLILAVWLMAGPNGWSDRPAQAHAYTQATAQPAPTVIPEPTTSPMLTLEATQHAAGVPLDVILVGVLMVFALIGIVVGFRTQRL